MPRTKTDKVTTKRPPPKLAKLQQGQEMPNDLVTLSDPELMEELEIDPKSKGIYQMKLRNENRIKAGSKEDPFPLPYRYLAGTLWYSKREIVDFREKHTFLNNPSRRGYV